MHNRIQFSVEMRMPHILFCLESAKFRGNCVFESKFSTAAETQRALAAQ